MQLLSDCKYAIKSDPIGASSLAVIALGVGAIVGLFLCSTAGCAALRGAEPTALQCESKVVTLAVSGGTRVGSAEVKC